jgi:hypothetical protein
MQTAPLESQNPAQPYGSPARVVYRSADDGLGSGPDFLVLIRLAVKAGTRRMRTESGLWLKNDAVLVELEVRLLDVFLQCEGHPIEASIVAGDARVAGFKR